MTEVINHRPPAESSQGQVTLWVEDRLTKEYLYALWGPIQKQIDVRVGGGNNTIRGLVAEARAHGAISVYGFCDRDFSNSNHDRWMDATATLSVFIPLVHEIENCLLDSEALTGCRLNLHPEKITAKLVEDKMRDKAASMLCWVTCRRLLADLQRQINDQFPKHPSVAEIATTEAVERYILEKPWYKEIAAKVGTIACRDWLRQEIAQSHALYAQALEDGSWKECFAGKEIFRDLRGWLYDNPTGSKSDRDVDLAKAVGEWQRQNGQEPAILCDLKGALLARHAAANGAGDEMGTMPTADVDEPMVPQERD